MSNCLRKRLAMTAMFMAILPLLSGCFSRAQRWSPHLRFGSLNIEADIEREDIIVLDTVEGSSSRKAYFLDLIQIIDGDKLMLFGIKFFKDKYVVATDFPSLSRAWNRAYYKALEQHPDADAVFIKSSEREESGIPLLAFNETVTFKGKAIMLKADK